MVDNSFNSFYHLTGCSECRILTAHCRTQGIALHGLGGSYAVKSMMK